MAEDQARGRLVAALLRDYEPTASAVTYRGGFDGVRKFLCWLWPSIFFSLNFCPREDDKDTWSGNFYVVGGERIIQPIVKLIKKANKGHTGLSIDAHPKNHVSFFTAVGKSPYGFPPHCVDGTVGQCLVRSIHDAALERGASFFRKACGQHVDSFGAVERREVLTEALLDGGNYKTNLDEPQYAIWQDWVIRTFYKKPLAPSDAKHMLKDKKILMCDFFPEKSREPYSTLVSENAKDPFPKSSKLRMFHRGTYRRVLKEVASDHTVEFADEVAALDAALNETVTFGLKGNKFKHPAFDAGGLTNAAQKLGEKIENVGESVTLANLTESALVKMWTIDVPGSIDMYFNCMNSCELSKENVSATLYVLTPLANEQIKAVKEKGPSLTPEDEATLKKFARLQDVLKESLRRLVQLLFHLWFGNRFSDKDAAMCDKLREDLATFIGELLNEAANASSSMWPPGADRKKLTLRLVEQTKEQRIIVSSREVGRALHKELFGADNDGAYYTILRRSPKDQSEDKPKYYAEQDSSDYSCGVTAAHITPNLNEDNVLFEYTEYTGNDELPKGGVDTEILEQTGGCRVGALDNPTFEDLYTPPTMSANQPYKCGEALSVLHWLESGNAKTVYVCGLAGDWSVLDTCINLKKKRPNTNVCFLWNYTRFSQLGEEKMEEISLPPDRYKQYPLHQFASNAKRMWYLHHPYLVAELLVQADVTIVYDDEVEEVEDQVAPLDTHYFEPLLRNERFARSENFMKKSHAAIEEDLSSNANTYLFVVDMQNDFAFPKPDPKDGRSLEKWDRSDRIGIYEDAREMTLVAKKLQEVEKRKAKADAAQTR